MRYEWAGRYQANHIGYKEWKKNSNDDDKDVEESGHIKKADGLMKYDLPKWDERIETQRYGIFSVLESHCSKAS